MNRCVTLLFLLFAAAACDPDQWAAEPQVPSSSQTHQSCPEGTVPYGAHAVSVDPEGNLCLIWDNAAVCIPPRSGAAAEEACMRHVPSGVVFRFQEVPLLVLSNEDWERNRFATYNCLALPVCD